MKSRRPLATLGDVEHVIAAHESVAVASLHLASLVPGVARVRGKGRCAGGQREWQVDTLSIAPPSSPELA